MELIGFIIRETPYLKVLQPIIECLADLKVPYVLFCYDTYRSEKEYSRASLENIKKSSIKIINGAVKVNCFKNDEELLAQIFRDKIKKLVSLEIYLSIRNYIGRLKQEKIKLYNILYLTDTLWEERQECITDFNRVYYNTEYLKNMHLDFLGIKEDKQRDRYLGSPFFDCLNEQTGNKVLVLLPNIRAGDVNKCFGNVDNFLKIIDKLSKNNKLIFKVRRKQWVPNQIKNYGEVFFDEDVMYPTTISRLYKTTNTSILFCSSGLYEAVKANQYVINIKIPLTMWSHNKNKLQQYFSSEVYNFNGVVESVSQSEVLGENWKLENKLNQEQREKWLNKYIGINYNGTNFIANDILN